MTRYVNRCEQILFLVRVELRFRHLRTADRCDSHAVTWDDLDNVGDDVLRQRHGDARLRLVDTADRDLAQRDASAPRGPLPKTARVLEHSRALAIPVHKYAEVHARRTAPQDHVLVEYCVFHCLILFLFHFLFRSRSPS